MSSKPAWTVLRTGLQRKQAKVKTGRSVKHTRRLGPGSPSTSRPAEVSQKTEQRVGGLIQPGPCTRPEPTQTQVHGSSRAGMAGGRAGCSRPTPGARALSFQSSHGYHSLGPRAPTPVLGHRSPARRRRPSHGTTRRFTHFPSVRSSAVLRSGRAFWASGKQTSSGRRCAPPLQVPTVATRESRSPRLPGRPGPRGSGARPPLPSPRAAGYKGPRRLLCPGPERRRRPALRPAGSGLRPSLLSAREAASEAGGGRAGPHPRRAPFP